VQDVEFTIQEGKLFMLQTRNGKRTAAAALKFSMDMVKEKLIDWETAVLRNPADQLDQLARPDLRSRRSQEGQGHRHRPPGRSWCRLRQDLLQRRPRRHRREKGEKVLLVRVETSPKIFAA
jgi:pyruvate,orthophosphate dikinase